MAGENNVEDAPEQRLIRRDRQLDLRRPSSLYRSFVPSVRARKRSKLLISGFANEQATPIWALHQRDLRAERCGDLFDACNRSIDDDHPFPFEPCRHELQTVEAAER